MKPHFTLSKKVIAKQHGRVAEVADTVSYSSKTNPLITPILEKSTDCTFSIHLPNELKHVKDLRRVLFLAQAWNGDLISELLGKGISQFAVDNTSDLKILLDYLEQNKQVELDRLFLRTKLKENTIRTEKYFVFGMNKDVVAKELKNLSTHPQIKSLGVHVHRKTQNIAEWNLIYEFSNMFDEETFSFIDVFNIGGGLPADYANTNTKVIQTIMKKLLELKQFLNEKETQLMIEPGRFIAAPAGTLRTEIISIYENNIVVNASVYNSDMDALIVPVKLIVEGEVEKHEGEPYVLKGITPCSMDLFRYRVYLKNASVGDELIFLNAGAYNFTTNFVDVDVLETKVID